MPSIPTESEFWLTLYGGLVSSHTILFILIRIANGKKVSAGKNLSFAEMFFERWTLIFTFVGLLWFPLIALAESNRPKQIEIFVLWGFTTLVTALFSSIINYLLQMAPPGIQRLFERKPRKSQH